MSEKPTKSPRERLPILLTAIGIGILLIASGITVQTGSVDALFAADVAEVTQTPTSQPDDDPTDTPRPATETIEPTPSATAEATEKPPTPTPTATEPSATTEPSGTTESVTPDRELPEMDSGTPLPTPVPTRSINTGSFAPPEIEPSATEIPSPAQPVPVPSGVTNVLLLGSDKRPNDGGFRTDTIIVVSINMAEGTVNMLSLPRDLYVYAPGWRMTKINTVFAHGESVGWSGGGFGLMQETLMYNFGIEVGHYAMVDLTGFQGIVDVMGGIEVPVDCQLQFYALKQPRKSRWDFNTYEEWEEYTAPDSGNWELYTLPVGVHELDGYLALRYARYRYGTSDFDRAFRQQQVLRAIMRKARENGFLNIPRIPALWQQYNDLVDTSMDVGNMLQFAPIAADLDGIEITSYVLTSNLLTGWKDPALEQVVYIPNDTAYDFINKAMQPPAQNYVVSNTVSVEVRNGTGFSRLDEVAANRLVLNGIDAVPTGFADSRSYQQTVIYDFTGRRKTSQLLWMQRNLHVADVDVIDQPDPNRQFDYVVVLGQDYRSCSRAPQSEQAPPPTPQPEVTPTPLPEETDTP